MENLERRVETWTPPTPVFFVSVADKGLRGAMSVAIASKGLKVAGFGMVRRWFARMANNANKKVMTTEASGPEGKERDGGEARGRSGNEKSQTRRERAKH
jgi:hypothetical protein